MFAGPEKKPLNKKLLLLYSVLLNVWKGETRTLRIRIGKRQKITQEENNSRRNTYLTILNHNAEKFKTCVKYLLLNLSSKREYSIPVSFASCEELSFSFISPT